VSPPECDVDLLILLTAVTDLLVVLVVFGAVVTVVGSGPTVQIARYLLTIIDGCYSK